MIFTQHLRRMGRNKQEENNMESMEKSVSREDEEFPEDVDKVLSGIMKSSYPTEDQLKKETGLSTGRFRKAIRRLEQSHLIRERVGGIHGTMFKLVSPEQNAPAEKSKTAPEHNEYPSLTKGWAKVKELYVEGAKYREIAEKTKRPMHQVSYICAVLIKRGEVERRVKQRGSKVVSPGGPPSPTFLELHEHGPEEANRDSPDDGEEDDDEPEVLEQKHPDVAEILKAFENGANEIRKMGWQVDVQVKLIYPVSILRGAS